MRRINIARVAHEVNRAYCQALGDNSQSAWEAAPEWQKISARLGVVLHLSGEHGPEASHASWMAQKVADGWRHGPEKDPEAKRHPCLVPFYELPVSQQAKDYIFRAVVHALRPEPLPDRVTPEAIAARIASCEFLRLPGTSVTICHVTLDNGYSVRGESACVDPANYDQALSERYAREDAERKLWPLLGFLLAEDHYRNHKLSEA
jgi:hypothetical protein